MLDSALETFIALNSDNGSVGEEAAQAAAARANVERGGTGLRLGDIIHFPTVEDWARKDYTTYNYVGGCAVVIERGGYKVPANFSASFFNRALRELKNGEETGARIKCTGKPVEDFYGFGGTEASAIRAMAGAVIKVTAVKRINCNVFDHYDTTSELERKPVVYRKDVRPVFGFEYVELPEALRPKTATPSDSKKGGAKPKEGTPKPLA